MGLYNFKAQFVPYILDGTKTHTIRAERKHPAKVGETLHLYTGLRQKGAKLLMRVPCVKVEPIVIDRARIFIAGVELTFDEKLLFAYRDGFRPFGLGNSFDSMLEFWAKNHGGDRFEGHIIHWDPKRRIDA